MKKQILPKGTYAKIADKVIARQKSLPKHDGAVEGQSWFRAIPLHEFVYGVIVGSLAASGCEGIENSCFRLFQIRQGENRL